jgi:hypothetical protein
MKPGVMLINTSRGGGVLDTVAVIDGIKAGQIGYLGIDVYEREDELFFQDLSDTIIQDDIFHLLQSFSNVIITAHQGFLTRNALANIATTTLESITAPPLRYGDVYRLKQKFPHLWIEINGGITQLPQVQDYLERVNGVMIGRAAYDHPYLFATVDGAFLGTLGGGHAALPGNLAWAGAKAQQNYPPHADAVCGSARQSPVEAASHRTTLPTRGRGGGGDPGPGGGQWDRFGWVSTGWGCRTGSV